MLVAGVMEQEVAQFFPSSAGRGNGGDAALPPGGQPLGPCPRCGMVLLRCQRGDEVRHSSTMSLWIGVPACTEALWLA